MLDILLKLLAVYAASVILLNLLLHGKATVAFFGWFRLYGVKVYLNDETISIGTVVVRPNHWSLWKGQLGSSQGAYVAFLLDKVTVKPRHDHADPSPGTKSSTSNSEKTASDISAKTAKRLSDRLNKFIGIPLEVKMHMVEVVTTVGTFTCESLWGFYYTAKHPDRLSVKVEGNLIGVKLNDFEMLDSVKIDMIGALPYQGEVQMDDLDISITSGDMNINTALFGPKKQEVASEHSEPSGPPQKPASVLERRETLKKVIDSIRVKNLLFTIEVCNVFDGNYQFHLEETSLMLRQADAYDVHLYTYQKLLHKLTMSIAMIQIIPLWLKQSRTQFEFINFANLVDLPRVINALTTISNEEQPEWCNQDLSLFRSFLTVTNITTVSNINEFFLRAPPIPLEDEENLSKSPAPPPKPPKQNFLQRLSPTCRRNLRLLVRKLRMKVQLLNSSCYIQLSQDFKLKLTLDDARFDGLTNTTAAWFPSELYGNTAKPIQFLSRGLQLDYVQGHTTTKLVEIKGVDFSAMVELGGQILVLDKVKLGIYSVEALLRDTALFSNLARIPWASIPQYMPRKKSMDHDEKPLIPISVQEFTFELDHFQFAACFENPVKYFNGEDQSEMNKFKRGVSLELGHIDAYYANRRCKIKTGFISAHLIKDFDEEHKLNRMPDKFLNIKDINVTIGKGIYLLLPEIDACISIETVWSILYVMAIIDNSLPPKEACKQQQTTTSKAETKAYRRMPLAVRINLVVLKLILPQNIKVAVELDEFKWNATSGGFRSFRFYVPHRSISRAWSPLLTFTYGHFRSLLGSDGRKETSFVFRSARLEVPFQYKFYLFFDNAKAFIKSIRQIKYNFKNILMVDPDDKSFKVNAIMPSEAKHPANFPRLRFTTKSFRFCIHDDPFEFELNRCFLLGKVEQQQRLAKKTVFAKYERQVNEKLEEKYPMLNFIDGRAVKPSTDVPPPRERSPEQDRATSPLANEFGVDVHAEYERYLKDYHQLVELPKTRLLVNISESWIIRARGSQLHALSNPDVFNDDPPVRDSFLQKFPVVSPGEVSPLFGVIIEDMLLKFDKPEFGLENIREFLYEDGDGLPLDTSYGILCPMNLNLKCKLFKITLKSYLAPLLVFGDRADDSRTVKIDGDLVFLEQMYVPDEIRYNWVPFVSQYKGTTDNLYAFHIPRTMTTVKLVQNLHATVTSQTTSLLSWAPAIQPAFSYAMDSFDSLSKPPLDASPHLGWWDKIPLVMHGSFDFSFNNGLDFFIKSGHSPSDYLASEAGFVFKWVDQTSLKIHCSKDPKEFLVVESNSFEFAIPSFKVSSNEYFFEGGGYEFRSYETQKRVLKFTNEPVTWKLGFACERNRGNNVSGEPGFVPRTRSFKPHYLVRLKNPATFTSEEEKAAHDSYKGWRSEYLHLALSVISNGVDACNSVHLTPLTVYNFMRWWNNFHQSYGLPIRSGSLFDKKAVDKTRVKFGSLLYSISYQLAVAPIYLTHVYRHTVDIRANSKVAFTGLKAFARDITVDLHQTKSGCLLNAGNDESEEAADETKRDLHLKMSKGILDFADFDLRFVSAQFEQDAVACMLAQEWGISQSDSGSESWDSESTSNSSSTGGGKNTAWFDREDYVELDLSDLVGEPKWKIIPFATSPRLYYVRDLENSSMTYPFDYIQSCSHDCQLGKRDVTAEAARMVQERMDSIELQKKVVNSQLDDDRQTAYKSVFEQRLSDLKERLATLQAMKKKFSEGVFPSYNQLHGNNSNAALPTIAYDGGSNHSLQDETPESFDGENLSRCITMTSSLGPPSRAGVSLVDTAERSAYSNRFIVYKADISWNTETKNRMLNYIDKISARHSLVFSLSRQAVQLAESLTNMQERPVCDGSGMSLPGWKQELENCATITNNFDRLLHDTSDVPGADADDTYLLKFIMPQIRVSNSDDHYMVLLSNQVDIKRITVQTCMTSPETQDVTATYDMETRDGVIISDAFLYVLDKEKALNGGYKFYTPDQPKWPPRIPVELYYLPDVLKSSTVVRNLSAGALIVRPNMLHISDKQDNPGTKQLKQTLQLMSPAVHVIANSHQFNVMYDCFMSLIEYQKTDSQNVREAVRKYVKFSDLNELSDVSAKIEELQQESRQINRCKFLLKSQNNELYEENSTAINIELEKLYLKLTLLVDYLQRAKMTRYNDSFDMRQLVLSAFNIELELKDESEQVFLALNSVDTFYSTIQTPDDASQNEVCIYDFICMDLSKDARYKTVITRYHGKDQKATNREAAEEKPMCLVDWRLLPPVGGISVMDYRTITFAPIKMQIDYKMAMSVYHYLFPDSKLKLSSAQLEDNDMNSVDSSNLADNGLMSISESCASGNDDEYLDDEYLDDEDDSSSILMPITSIGSDSSQRSASRKSGHKVHSLANVMSRTHSNASTNSVPKSVTFGGKAEVNTHKGQSHKRGQDIEEMERRAKTYTMGNLITLNPLQLCLTFKGTGSLKMIDVTDFVIETPTMELKNTTLSTEEFLALLRLKVLRIVIKNLPKFVRSKFHHSKKAPEEEEQQQYRRSSAWSLNPFSNTRSSGSSGSSGNMLTRTSSRYRTRRGHHKFLDPDLMEPVLGRKR